MMLKAKAPPPDTYDKFDAAPPCLSCGVPASLKCSKCLGPYCSQSTPRRIRGAPPPDGEPNAECQREHWKAHKPQCNILLRVEEMIARSRKMQPKSDAIVYLETEGDYFLGQARNDAALKLYEEGIALARRSFGESHYYTGVFYGKLGNVLHGEGRYEEAIAMLE